MSLTRDLMAFVVQQQLEFLGHAIQNIVFVNVELQD